MSSTKSPGRQGEARLKTCLQCSSKSAACSWSPSFPYCSNISNANPCLRTKARDKLPSFPWCVGPPAHASRARLPRGSRPCLNWLSLRKQASGFMWLLSQNSRWTEGLWRRSTRGPGSLLQNLRPTCLGLLAQELTSGGDPEVLKLSLVRETGGGTSRG